MSEGAVRFYLDNFVSARVMRSTYGTESTVDFDPSNPQHQARRASKLHRPSGRVVLPESFSTILSKVCVVPVRPSKQFFLTAY